jgi:hypothetical protein
VWVLLVDRLGTGLVRLLALVYCSVLGVGTVSGQIGHWAVRLLALVYWVWVPYSQTPSAYVPPSMSPTKFHTHTNTVLLLYLMSVMSYCV